MLPQQPALHTSVNAWCPFLDDELQVFYVALPWGINMVNVRFAQWHTLSAKYSFGQAVLMRRCWLRVLGWLVG